MVMGEWIRTAHPELAGTMVSTWVTAATRRRGVCEVRSAAPSHGTAGSLMVVAAWCGGAGPVFMGSRDPDGGRGVTGGCDAGRFTGAVAPVGGGARWERWEKRRHGCRRSTRAGADAARRKFLGRGMLMGMAVVMQVAST